MEEAYQLQLERFADKFKELDEKKASGAMSQVEYTQRVEAVKELAHNSAVNGLWNRHALDHGYRRSVGLPTPEPRILNYR
jgi:hypothetical protein